MKYLIVFISAILAILPSEALAIHIQAPMIRMDLNSNKVLVLAGEVNADMTLSARMQLRANETLPGPQIVLINSPGGSLDEGAKIIKLLNEIRHQGVRTVCVVMGNAHSMAFDILTQACDVRLAVAGSHMVVHKAAFGPGACEGQPRCTARNLRDAATKMDQADEVNTVANQVAMHMTRAEYDRYADNETDWQALTLLMRHYLDGMAIVNP